MRRHVAVTSPIQVKFCPDIVTLSFQAEERTKFGTATFEGKVGDKTIVFFPNGNIVVRTSNREIARDILNSIRFSMLLLCNRQDVFYKALTIDDLFYVQYNGAGSYIADINDHGFITRVEAVDWSLLHKNLAGIYLHVSRSQIPIICALADEIYYSAKKDSILLFFDCYSSRQHASYNDSFMQGWVCIELSLYLIIERMYVRHH